MSGAIKLYTVAEAAELIGIGRSTLYRALSAGQVPHRLLPGTDIVRLTLEDVEEYIANAYRPASTYSTPRASGSRTCSERNT